MKILVAIPCLYGADYVRESVKSVCYEKDVDVLLIDNGGDEHIKALIDIFYADRINVYIIRNDKNLYVNKAWQQAIDWFLDFNGHTHLIIMNSDLFMQPNWSKVIFNRLSENENEIIIPNISDDKLFSSIDTNQVSLSASSLVYSGTPGVFILINKKQAELVSPLPFDICKVWFGDEWIYTILRALGFKTVIPSNLYCHHLWSATLNQVEGIREILEEDKKQWIEVGTKRMLDLIKKNNG